MANCSRRLSKAFLCASFAALLLAKEARAAELQPIRSNDYNLELVFSPVLASGRETALAGAGVAIASGVDGATVSAASPAVRDPKQRGWFEWDVGASISLPGALRTDGDVFNAGERGVRLGGLSTQGWVHASLGLNLQFGAFGVTHSTQADSFAIQRPEGSLLINFARHSELVAHSFERGQLVIGAGIRIMSATVDVSVANNTKQLLSLLGAAPEVGASWMPDGKPYRLSATLRAPINVSVELGERESGVAIADSLALPSGIRQPWELDFGVAYQLGPRPLNVAWDNPHDGPQAPAKEYPRQRATLLLSMRVLGANQGAVSLLGFAEQVKDGSSAVTFAPHFGLETEPWPNAVKIRTGAYLEPARLVGSNTRPHWTSGLEVRIAHLDPFSFVKGFDLGFQAYLDAAPRYTNIGGFFTIWK